MSYIPSSAMPHAYTDPSPDLANDDNKDGAENGFRATIDEGVNTAREAIQNVPTKAWTIGAVVAGVAASVALGALAASSRNGAGSKSRNATRRPAAKRRTAKARTGANEA